MTPLIKANRDSSDANRELVLSMIESHIEQSRVTVSAMRNIANAFTKMTDEMEQQQAETEQGLREMADSLEVKADSAFRKKAGQALRDGAIRLRNLINKLG